MARQVENFVCQSCGAVYGKWQGRCEACGEWNTIAAEAVEAGPPGSIAAGKPGKGKVLEFSSLKGGGEFEPRLLTGNAEFDRACGGGLVPGSALLIGGDPGVGKSTLLLQIASGLAKNGAKVAYISGEEATAQIRLRA
ncbi:MAG: ATPase domain-containing protein, partial [Pseudomonadota bacterium]